VIRNAVPADIDKIVELGIESLELNDPYPELLISEAKIRRMTVEVVSSKAHFSWVCEVDGEVIGAVCGLSHDIMFHERKQLSVLLFYCRSASGGGFLIRKMIRWFKSRPVLKMIVMTLDGGDNPKLGALLVKMGLDKKMLCYAGTK